MKLKDEFRCAAIFAVIAVVMGLIPLLFCGGAP